ncbi:glycosyltransferase [Reyranella sp.]|uniref:glycosyltransferase n=1 Tax=Reyranella sp. TaxID=1929291 RepID=UPI002727462A|nr:glycosyltransferase [Reyranella sp.]MDO8973680.1 glycosyltransferase [Reyranella sp.]
MTELFEQSPFDPAKERRIVIIADWLPPDFGAVGQYMQMRAQGLAEQGHDVTLVGLSTGSGSKSRRERGKGSLTEIRLSARPVPRGSLLGRMLWTIATNLRLILAAFGPLRAADGILFTGSPPFLIHLLVPLKLLWRGRLIYRITDFHPECLIAARDRPSRALRLLLGLTNFWRRRVDGFEVLGEDQRRRLNGTGVPAGRIALVRDGSPVTFVPDGPVEPLPAELAGKCVLLYSGNYGVAHEVETVVRGYELHHRRGSGRVHLWLSATGAGAEEVACRLGTAGLPFHRSSPVALEKLAGLLRAPAAHLVTLRDSFVGYVMPSKIYACLESAKPVLFVGSADSDVDLLARAIPEGYWRVSCGDVDGFASALEALADRSIPALSDPTKPKT